MKDTKIELAHHTFNPWIGCSRSEFEKADAAINAAARTKFPRRAA